MGDVVGWANVTLGWYRSLTERLPSKWCIPNVWFNLLTVTWTGNKCI